MPEITYAKAGGPPDDWYGLKVFDLDAGHEVTEVYECNAAEGWLIRAKHNERGELYVDPETNDAARERLTGRFEIRRPN